MDAQITTQPTTEIWQVDTGGQIYETNFDELIQWIAEDALLPQDKVRRGNLRWIEANKVPSLHGFFNAKQLGIAPPALTVKTVQPTTANIPQTFSQQVVNIPQPIIDPPQIQKNLNFTKIAENKFCLVHIETKPDFICTSCTNVFCGECPTRAAGNIWICPMCNEMCKSLNEVIEKEKQANEFQTDMKAGFGITDFARAFAYPFKFKISLFFGALIFMVVSVGQGAAAVGGSMLLVAAIFCWMIGNMMTFGILSNTIENMLKGKIKEDFMPSFEDFSFYDDVLQPFGLSIGIYFVSFGALVVLIAVVIFGLFGSINSPNSSPHTVQTFAPQLQGDFNSTQISEEQMNKFREMAKQGNGINIQQGNGVTVQQIDRANIPQDAQIIEVSEAEFNRITQTGNQPPLKTEINVGEVPVNNNIPINPNVGQMPQNNALQTMNKINQFLDLGLPVIGLSILAVLWGLFYLPVAYIVAAYTRNLGSVLNPLIGLDTIKRLGFDYVKILFFSFVLVVMVGAINLALRGLLADFDLPRIGNIPVMVIASFFNFYFSIVFAVMLGFALYKNLDSFKMYQNT